jgi:TPR repeat protein
MHLKVAHVAAKLMHSLAAAVGSKVGKEAEELHASGQRSAAAVALKLAVDLGHLPSLPLKAWMMMDDSKDDEVLRIDEDFKAVFELLEEGARLGCHHCQGVMARCYKSGFGCEADEERSLELARESSRKGSRYGQYELGDWYEERADYIRAAAQYRLAAAQNLDWAQLSLGIVHWRISDYAAALRWFQLAAAQGHYVAMSWVASFYEKGHGVPENKAEAIRWYKRAQEAGDPDAADDWQKLLA